MSLSLTLVSGAGNRFALADLFRGDAPEDPAALARQLSAKHTLDGLLVLSPPSPGAEPVARFEVWNADGTEAAACGNGLRCAARRWFENVAQGFAPPFEADQPELETAAGPRTFDLVDWIDERAVLLVAMGRAEPVELTEPITHDGRTYSATVLELGNLHCVLQVDDERAAPVESLGRALQQHPVFPGGVNVGFLARRAGAFHLRVFERGVGETAACGSGACAAAVASGALAGGPLTIHMPGGVLGVERSASGELSLSGEALEHGPLEFVSAPRAAAARQA